MKQLLAIDDDPAICHLLSKYLSRTGYQIQVTSDPIRGIRMATENPPDLILLDVVMEIMGGVKVLELLSRDPNTVGLPIILISAYSLSREIPERIRSMLLDGAVEFLPKPFNLPDLSRKIKEVLDMDGPQWRKTVSHKRLEIFNVSAGS